jgi:hypothetical protein
MLLPLLKLGHFKPVREALDYIFSLQDSGMPPRGRLTTTAGAVGTSGPKWLNTTGCALAIAAEYFLHTMDAEFWNEFETKVLRAMDWIVGELRATRQLNADGSRPTQYGLMPFGCATDGDVGHVIAYTDAYTFWGLEKAAALLKEIGHERAAEMEAEVALYRSDIRQAAAALAREDGFIERKIVTGDHDEEYYEPFELTCGAYHLVAGNALIADDPLIERYIEYFERMRGADLFAGRMDHDTAYIGLPEWIWQEIYLRRGEWKKAFACLEINWRYGKTRDTHQSQERFRMSDPTFCPWQPNGSGNGRLLDMMIKAMYFEHDGVATLFAGVPFEWLRKNGVTELESLHTRQGVLSLRAAMLNGDECKVEVTFSDSKAIPHTIRFPDHLHIKDAEIVDSNGFQQIFVITSQLET